MAGQVGMGTALATGNLPAAATSSIGAALLRSAANRGASTFAAGSYAASRGFKALANAAARNPALTRSLGAMLGSGFARDAVVDAQRASDPDSGLTPEEMNTLASLLQRMRGQ